MSIKRKSCDGDNCEGRNRRRFKAYRLLMFLAGLSLMGYVPYKMLAQPEAMTGLYGILFPSSLVLAIAGMFFAVRPALAHRMPLFLSIPTGLLAAGWLTTGLECVPTFAKLILTHPLGGLFATAHMSLQHVVLSVSLAMLVLAPRATYEFFGVPQPGDEPEDAEELTQLNV